MSDENVMEIGTRRFTEWCWDKSVGVDWLIPVGPSINDPPNDHLQQALEEASEKRLAKLFPKFEGDEWDVLELIDWMHEESMEGWLFQARTPVRRYGGDGMSHYSWGHFYLQLFLADSLASAFTQIAEWVEERNAKDRETSQAVAR